MLTQEKQKKLTASQRALRNLTKSIDEEDMVSCSDPLHPNSCHSVNLKFGKQIIVSPSALPRIYFYLTCAYCFRFDLLVVLVCEYMHLCEQVVGHLKNTSIKFDLTYYSMRLIDFALLKLM